MMMIRTNRVMLTWLVAFGGAALAFACSGGDDTSSSSSSGSQSSECKAGEVEACYSGAEATKDVGACHAGERTCGEDGSWGACEGEQTPADETCNTTEDDDCDGQVNEEGDGCVCLPDSSQDCYGGPANSAGVGQCKAGTQVCNDQGTEWGSCDGEVTPDAEDCEVLGDEDCDGVGCSEPVHNIVFGGPEGDQVNDLAFDGQGNLVVVGQFAGALNIAGTTLTSAGGWDLFVAKLDAAGKLLWAKGFGSKDGIEVATAVAVDSNDDIVVVGHHSKSFDIGSGPLPVAGSGDGFVAKLDPSGATLFSDNLALEGASTPATGIKQPNHVAVDSKNNIAIGGYYTGRWGCSSGICAISDPTADDWAGFILTRASNGAPGWRSSFDKPMRQSITSVEFDSQDQLVVAGRFQQQLSFGNSTISGPTNNGEYDGFVGLMNAAGQGQWVRQLHTKSTEGPALALDSKDDIIIAGRFGGSITLGPVPVNASGQDDMFVAKYSNSNTHLWGKRFGGAQRDFAIDVAVDSKDAVLLAGTIQDKVTFGGEELSSAGEYDAALVKLDGASGGHIFSRAFGSAKSELGLAIDAGPNDLIGLGGMVSAEVDFGLGPLSVAGSYDAFAAVFNP